MTNYPPSLREVAFSQENDGGSLFVIFLLPQSPYGDSSPSSGEPILAFPHRGEGGTSEASDGRGASR